MDEAEYEFVVQDVELLQEVQKKYTKSLTIEVPIELMTTALADELEELLRDHKGDIPLRLQISDETSHHVVSLVASGHSVMINKPLYKWLRARERDNELAHHIN